MSVRAARFYPALRNWWTNVAKPKQTDPLRAVLEALATGIVELQKRVAKLEKKRG
jgi:hypothetical protein